jgi:hypothetical protein
MENPMVQVPYKIPYVLADMIAFYGANYAVDKLIVDISNVHLKQTIIFGISDLLVKNQWIATSSIAPENIDPMTRSVIRSGAVASTSFIAATLFDITLGGSSFFVALKRNLVLNAIGFGSNLALDRIFV